VRIGGLIGLVALISAGAVQAANWVPDVELWRGLRSGMSEAYVVSRFPDVRRSKPGPTISSGGRPEFAVDSTFNGRPVEATFFFDKGQLSDILVSFKGLVSGVTANNLTSMHELAVRMSKIYGKPHMCRDGSITAPTHIENYRCNWLQGDLKVDIIYLDVNGNAPTMDVSYHANAKAATDDF
jgi:hypothetical protein